MVRRLKHRNYTITRFLDALNVEYQSVDHDPDWIIVHPQFGNYLVHDKNILENLSPDNLARLKSKQASLLFWYPYETEHYGHPNVRRQIEACMDCVGLKSDQVFLATGNLNAGFKGENMSKIIGWHGTMTSAFFDYVGKVHPGFLEKLHQIRSQYNHIQTISLREQRILEACKKLPFPKDFSLEQIQDVLTREQLVDIREPVKSIPMLWFDWQLNDFLDEREELDQRQITYVENKSKAYMCLNGKDKHTRRYLLDRLPLKDGHVSYVCYDGVDTHIRGTQTVPIILDQGKHSLKRNDRWMNPLIYHDAYINVVAEAFPDKEIDCFITEKTFKPMLQLQPFLIQGNRYTLRRLREYGYQTFSDIWDESYDELETWQERTDAMLEQLHSFCRLSSHEQLEKCKQVMWKLQHNQEMVLKTSSDVTRSAHLADILRAFSSGG